MAFDVTAGGGSTQAWGAPREGTGSWWLRCITYTAILKSALASLQASFRSELLASDSHRAGEMMERRCASDSPCRQASRCCARTRPDIGRMAGVEDAGVSKTMNCPDSHARLQLLKHDPASTLFRASMHGNRSCRGSGSCVWALEVAHWASRELGSGNNAPAVVAPLTSSSHPHLDA